MDQNWCKVRNMFAQ